MDDVTIARGMALTQAHLRQLELSNRYFDGWKSWKLTPDQAIFLTKIYSAKPRQRMLWCNRNVRRAASEAIIDAVLADFVAQPALRRYFITFCWDAGSTWERRPEIDAVTLKNMIQHRIRRLGLHGIGVVEIDVLTNIAGEPGRRLMVHVHCYCWGDDALRPNAISSQLSKLPALSNNLGAAGVKIQPVKLYEISVAQLAGYMFKVPSREKNRVPLKKGANKFAMRDARLQTQSAVRLIEVLSHFEFGDLLFGVGEGSALAAAIRGKFSQLVKRWRSPRWDPPSANDVAAIWKAIRDENGSRSLAPCRIRAKARASAWIDASLKHNPGPCNVD